MSFQVGERFYIPGGWPTPVSQGRKFLHLGPFQILPYVFDCSFVSFITNEQTKVNVFLSFVNCGNK